SVSALDCVSHATLENREGLAGRPGFRFVQGTILDPSALAAVATGAEALVHLAAGKIPRYGDALATLVTTGEGGLQVLRACTAHGVRRMVLASTSDCYGR